MEKDDEELAKLVTRALAIANLGLIEFEESITETCEAKEDHNEDEICDFCEQDVRLYDMSGEGAGRNYLAGMLFTRAFQELVKHKR